MRHNNQIIHNFSAVLQHHTVKFKVGQPRSHHSRKKEKKKKKKKKRRRRLREKKERERKKKRERKEEKKKRKKKKKKKKKKKPQNMASISQQSLSNSLISLSPNSKGMFFVIFSEFKRQSAL